MRILSYIALVGAATCFVLFFAFSRQGEVDAHSGIRLEMDEPAAEFSQFGTYNLSGIIRNDSDEEIILERFFLPCSCLQTSNFPITIRPREAQTVSFSMYTGSKKHQQELEIEYCFHAAAPESPTVWQKSKFRFSVSEDILSKVSEENSGRSDWRKSRVVLASRCKKDFRISSAAFLNFPASERTRSFLVDIKSEREFEVSYPLSLNPPTLKLGIDYDEGMKLDMELKLE